MAVVVVPAAVASPGLAFVLSFETATRISLAALLLLALSGLLRWRRLPSGLRYLAGFGWFTLAIEVLVDQLWQRHLPNLFLMPLDAAGSFVLLSLVYRWALRAAWFTRVQPWLAGGFILYAVLTSLLAPEMARFKPTLQVLQGLLVLGFVALYVRKLLSELLVHDLRREPIFWVAVGSFIYFLGDMQIVLFSNYLMHYSKELNILIWTVHNLLSTVLYLCYCLALWVRPRK